MKRGFFNICRYCMFLLFLLSLFSVSAFEVNAGVFSNTVSECSAESNAKTKSSFGSDCDVVNGSSLELSDGVEESHDSNSGGGKKNPKYKYGGVRVKSYNVSVNSSKCKSVDSVSVCYEWRTGANTPLDCDVSVDSNNGSSYSSVVTSCPSGVSGGVNCVDVTSVEDWSCSDFFSSNASAVAKSELSSDKKATTYWDTLYFKVNYSSESSKDFGAGYSSSLGSPYCPEGESPCTTNSSLIKCRDNVADGYGPEPHSPNTIDSCTDGSATNSSPSCGQEESVENITVVDLNSSYFTGGDTVKVNATFVCRGSQDDHLGLYYTNDSNSADPSWRQVDFRVDGCSSSGVNRVSFNKFKLDNTEGNHSVRAYITYDPSSPPPEKACANRTSNTNGGGPNKEVERFDDNDDLSFKVYKDLSSVSTGFTVTLPDGSNVSVNESRNGTTKGMFFNVSSFTSFGVEPCVKGGACQNETTPFFVYTNTGDVSINISLSLNKSLSKNISLKANSVYNYSDSVGIGTGEVSLVNSLFSGDSESVWFWSDFVNVSEGDYRNTLKSEGFES